MVIIIVFGALAVGAVCFFLVFLCGLKRYIAKLHRQRLEEDPDAEPLLVEWPRRNRAVIAHASRETVDGVAMTDSAGVRTGDVRITVQEEETEFGPDPKEFARGPPVGHGSDPAALYDVPPPATTLRRTRGHL